VKKPIENIDQDHPWKQWVAIGLIVIATTIVYHNSLKAPFILDDIGKIVENPDIQKLSNLKTKLVYPYNKQYFTPRRNDPSRPLVSLTFTLNYYFGKLNTFGYHLFNLLIHILNAILIFFLTKKIISLVMTSQSLNPHPHRLVSQSETVGGSISQSLTFPFFVALFFAVHPISTSAVTYIFSRSDVLSTFFYISSLLLFAKTFEGNKIPYVLSLVCFILALFSKQIAVTLPAIVLIFDYIFLNNFSIRKTIDKKYYHIPFWILLIIYLLFRYLYLGGMGDIEGGSVIWDRYNYLIIQPYIILRYLKLLFIPIGLCIDYVIDPMKFFELKTILSCLSVTMIFWLIYKMIYRKKTNISKITLFSVLWFFIILSPTSSFFPTTSALVENRLYLSGIGFYFFIVFLYFRIFKIDFAEKLNLSRNWVLLSVISLHIVLFGYGAIKRNRLYQNPILLWQDAISKYPNNERAHNNLGLLFYNSNRFVEAEKEYKEAIRINPNLGDAHYNLGLLLHNLNRYSEAEKEYREAIRINPNYGSAHGNIGALLSMLERYDEAEKEFREAIKINPNIVGVHYELGLLLFNLNRFEEAEEEFREVIRINPNSANAHYNLGVLLYNSKRFKEAEKEFKAAKKK